MRSPKANLMVVCTLLVLSGACAGSVSGGEDRNRATGGGAGASGADGAGAGASGSNAGAGGNGGAGNGPVVCDASPVGLRRLWRLTARQYDNTIRDLLGLTGSWGSTFPADTVVDGFANNADALTVSPLLADKLREAAEDIASQVQLASLATCASTQVDVRCMNELVETLGKRVFRRPLTQEEVDRYGMLAATETAFESGARLVVTAMLQSPHFLYRREVGALSADARYLLDDYEVASELSYLMWQTTPSEALLASADAGELHTQEQIEAAATSMLTDEKSRPMVRAFVLEWLSLDAIPTVPKDTERFPELTTELRASMLAEVERFVDYVMFEQDGSLTTLLTAPVTFIDERLATLYGADISSAPADASGMHEVILTGQERIGILTLGGVMMRHGRSNDSSPVHRGRLVRERFFCQIPPPPPPGIVVQPPPDDPTKTSRERYAAHSENQPCLGCHVMMDPIGFSFERFDGIGRYRDTENGQAIDVTGEILQTPSSDRAFEGTAELASVLAESTDVSECVTRQWLRFAYGMKEEPATRCVTEPLVDEVTGEGVTLQALIAASVRNPQLRERVSLNDAPSVAPTDGGVIDPTSASGDAGIVDPNPIDPEPDASVEPAPTLGLTLVNNNDYGTGYCHTYEIRNDGTTSLTWDVPIELQGTLTQHWESLVDGAMGVTSATGTVTFTGVSHNATLSPAATTQFGFCVTR